MEEITRAETVKAAGHLKEMGKDEMNFAEFPLAALAGRIPGGCKTLVFEDCIHDRSRNDDVQRRLTISASDKFGLPTATDDEVILGLVQISKAAGFAERRVRFSRYQLIRLLGWREEGRSYRRLEESLKRWLGVTLYYEKAWWDNASQHWVDANFHLLDNVDFYRRESSKPGRATAVRESALSYFTWNERVFRSFQAGYLRTLDLNFYRGLKSAVTKRLYRFLDKKFYKNKDQRFKLRVFACEHIGLSRGYDTAQLKRRLSRAIAELEQAEYLVSMPASKRFRRLKRGEWEIVFRAAVTRKPGRSEKQLTGMERRLAEYGVSAGVATRLIQKYPAEYIEQKVAMLEALLSHRAPRNPAGYLVQSIRSDYRPPAGIPAAAGNLSVSAAKSRAAGAGPAASRPQRPIGDDEQKRIDDYLAALSPENRARLCEDAISKAPGFTAVRLRQAVAEGNEQRAAQYREAFLLTHVRALLRAAAEENVISLAN